MKRILTAAPIALICLFLLPFLALQSARGWDVLGYVVLFFFILYPALFIFLGILAGTNPKLLWWLPVGACVLMPPLFWLASGDMTPELYAYAPLYLALAFVAALPTALIRHYLLFKKKRDLSPSAHEKN